MFFRPNKPFKCERPLATNRKMPHKAAAAAAAATVVMIVTAVCVCVD